MLRIIYLSVLISHAWHDFPYERGMEGFDFKSYSRYKNTILIDHKVISRRALIANYWCYAFWILMGWIWDHISCSCALKQAYDIQIKRFSLLQYPQSYDISKQYIVYG